MQCRRKATLNFRPDDSAQKDSVLWAAELSFGKNRGTHQEQLRQTALAYSKSLNKKKNFFSNDKNTSVACGDTDENIRK